MGDWWSLGVVFCFIMANGSSRFVENWEMDLVCMGSLRMENFFYQPSAPSPNCIPLIQIDPSGRTGVGAVCMDFLLAMTEINVSERLTPASAAQHPWLEEVDWMKVSQQR